MAMTAAPVRLQLSRRKGFDLQRLSLATNGLPAVNVARPSKWGNPFRVGDLMECNGERFSIGSALHARTLFRDNVVLHYLSVATSSSGPTDRRRGVLGAKRWLKEAMTLRGKNLACWCAVSHDHYIPCHADVLLSLANSIPLKDVINENIRRAKGEKDS